MPKTTFKYFVDKDGTRSQLDYNGLAGIPIEVHNRVEVLGETHWVLDEYVSGVNMYAYCIDEEEYPTDMFISGDSYVLTVNGTEYYCKAASSAILFEPNADYWDEQIFTLTSIEGETHLLVPFAEPEVTVKVEKADIIWRGSSSLTKVYCGHGTLSRDSDSGSDRSGEPNFVKYTCELHVDAHTQRLQDNGWWFPVPILGEICELHIGNIVLVTQCCGIDEYGYQYSLPLLGESRISDLHFILIPYPPTEAPAEFFVMLDETQLGDLDGISYELYYYPITKGAPRLYVGEPDQQDSYGFSMFDWVSFGVVSNTMSSFELRSAFPVGTIS